MNKKNKWNYGNEIQHDFPYIFENGSKLYCLDWTKERLPEKMKSIEVLFVDPPWNISNVNSFYTKADKVHVDFSFAEFLGHLYKKINDIEPKILFLEIGKEYLAEVVVELKKEYKYVTFYNSKYYNNNNNFCYIVHATNIFKQSKMKELNNVDEEKAIELICNKYKDNIIGDLCMGKGLVAYYSNLNNTKFYGTELNSKRLSIAVERVLKNNRKIGGK